MLMYFAAMLDIVPVPERVMGGAGGGHKDIGTLCFDRFGACYCM